MGLGRARRTPLGRTRRVRARPAANAIPIDATTADGFERYAALPIAYGTARRMLFVRALLDPGEKLLVLGAAGGVGVACVQFGARHGAHVIACSTPTGKLDGLKALGAHDVINTADGADERFLARVRDITGGTMAGVVVDCIGRTTWNTSIRATRRHTGRLLTSGASSGYDAPTDLRYLWTREIDIRGSNGWERTDLTTVVELVRDGRLDPVIHAVLPLSRVHDAFEELERRRPLGKVIVVPDGVG